MEGLINVLKELQNVIQRGLTNFKKSPRERLTVDYIQTKEELLERDWNLFTNNYTKLYELYTTKDNTKIVEMYDSTEDTYITYKCLIKSTLSKYSISKKTDKESSSSSSVPKSCTFVKLPKIAIPIFSGKYSEWTTFRDLFVSLVHKNDGLDNVQKMHYLKSHLSGEAEQLVRQTPVSDSNYVQCWATLEKRYSNRKYLVSCILQRLFGQKRMQVESASSLKEMLDTTNDCLNALKNLKVDVTTWDVLIIHISAFKLDSETRKQWEFSISNLDSDELPTCEGFATFLENRFRALEFIEPKRNNQVNNVHSPKAMVVSSSSIKCEFCSESHKLCFCKSFAKQPVDHRRDFVAKHKMCFNCLGGNHMVVNCKNSSTCKLCHKRHHSLLHPSGQLANKVDASASTATVETNPSTSSTPVVSCLSTNKVPAPGQVLLATALVNIESKMGYQTVRALVDQGSQACFITESTVQFLRLKKIPIHGLVSGLGQKSTIAKHMVNVEIQSRVDPEFKINLNAYVISKITSYLPERTIDQNSFDWIDFTNLKLADPLFCKPSKIDLLLGADVYGCMVKEGMIKSPSSSLVAQSTSLGWLLSGVVDSPTDSRHTPPKVSVMHINLTTDQIIRRFWEIEDQISTKKMLTIEEQKCEDLYASTTKRTQDGRYEVRLPFRVEDPPCTSGDSRSIAENRLKSLEKRLGKNVELKKKYKEVIQEYLHLGHLRPVKEGDNKRDIAVYLPHHAVIREDKSTTKVRVVFNASEKNKRGVSLNDTLMVGPTLQADLRHTVLRWRRHSIGLVADIVKMYRQVRVADDHAMYQRILWRDNPEEEIKDYELVTVTFGTASAPYQAVRTLHQISYDEGGKYPLAAERVLNSFYVDDFMSGCEDVTEGIELYKQMNELLGKGGFQLQKWNSNSKEILEKIRTLEGDQSINKISSIESNKEDNENNTTITNNYQKEVTIKVDDTMKILGLTWDRQEDSFRYTVCVQPSNKQPVTKRAVVSDIAKLFDPLGWLAPTIVLAKIFIQKLWLAGIGWDEQLTTDLIQEWYTYQEELPLLSKVKIPRWLGTRSESDIELHGFCDASKAAYSAVVYLRLVDSTDKIKVSLLVAKTRVAPIKQVSIPRLELCGAVLLANLLAETAEVLNVPKEKIKAWTDSTVALAWLNNHPSRWKTFVANRTSEILNVMSSSQWHHVATSENPADCASRGLMPSTFIQNTPWFSGPQFLKEKTITYNKPKDLAIDLEQSIKTHIAISNDSSDDNNILDKFSSLQRLLRIVAYCRRVLKSKGDRSTYLQKREIEEALECCLRKIQREQFTIDYTKLKNGENVNSKSSKIKHLCPYLDNKGIMRVQGRIDKSILDEQMKHPIVLPNDTHFTRLLVADAHHKTLHGGPQLMTNYLRSAYWIIGVRNLVKQCVRKCVTCAKQKATIKNQFMGSLPASRCSPAKPFLHSGVDYAGPINVRTTKGRGQRSYKGYICLFVCMSTRALHLEVVSDMTTQAFLAAFRRFVSRRGHCAKLWSDNGTTFVGASRELRQIVEHLHASVAEHLEATNTEWHFIPPHAPNFGGLWEAGVKSTKFHLKRVIGESTLTYEELSTLLTQVEACLNSRPMSIINSEDPSEPIPLTPGHFLVGEPLISVPDYNYESLSVNSLTRWQYVQRMLQSFWRRWSQEYLANLMSRYKWSSRVPEPNIGDVVLIKEDDLPPSRWALGRVLEKHPGDDQVTRVVTLRTKSSTIKRPTNKICILPVADS
ncbi:hypothetical protein PYW08_015821 [Mythimna loreyi]|uniref:Uncharacterized protein n=1 Tax=Mythimna loreyi TaxID=667449 RepID=A0ACC2QSS4_9NEOP|nr:hypothetical protein PYW08_015821 [Mythimna loreyi]